jgi:hypothetical protein
VGEGVGGPIPTNGKKAWLSTLCMVGGFRRNLGGGGLEQDLKMGHGLMGKRRYFGGERNVNQGSET